MGSFVALATCGGPVERGAARVTLDVQFRATELDSKPLPGIPVRLVIGADLGWQNPDAGTRFVTDANGEYRFRTTAVLDKRLRKRPTNFVSTLLSRAQSTDHLAVAAELPYMTFRWLYALDVYRFPDETTALLDGFSVYTPDVSGRFTRRAAHDERGWRMPGLGGMVLTTPGYDPRSVVLQRDESDPAHSRWSLSIVFQRQPVPVRR